MNPQLVPYVVALLVSSAVLVGHWAFVGRAARRRRMDNYKAKVEAGHGVAPEPFELNLSRLKKGLANLLTSLGERLKPRDASKLSQSRAALIRAGYRSPRAMVIYWGVKGALLVLPASAFLLLRLLLFRQLPMPATMSATIVVMLVGFYLPKLWLNGKINARRKIFLKGLPDALDLLVVCVESGMGLDQGLHRVGMEMRYSYPVIFEELRILNLEQRAGKPRSEALRDLAARVNLEDLSSLVTLIIQSEAFGTSVAQTLRVYSDVLRTKRSQRAEEQAAKLPVKLLFPLIFFIFPALFVVLAGPAGISLMKVFAK